MLMAEPVVQVMEESRREKKRRLKAELARVRRLVSELEEKERLVRGGDSPPPRLQAADAVERAAAEPEPAFSRKGPEQGTEAAAAAESSGAGDDEAFTKERRAVAGSRMTVSPKVVAIPGGSEYADDVASPSTAGEPVAPADGTAVRQAAESLPADRGRGLAVALPATASASAAVAASWEAADKPAASKVTWKLCAALLQRLMAAKGAYSFNQPVGRLWPALLPDYMRVILEPMDLGTVRDKLRRHAYRRPEAFAADVRLTFRNAKTYNPPGTFFHSTADDLLQDFEARYRKVEKAMVDEEKRAAAGTPRLVPRREEARERERLSKSEGKAAIIALPAASQLPVESDERDGNHPWGQEDFSGLRSPQEGSSKGGQDDGGGGGDDDGPMSPPPPRPRRDRRPPSVQPSGGSSDGESPDGESPVGAAAPAVSHGGGRQPKGPLLGRMVSEQSYGGRRPLSLREKVRLMQLIQTLPEDRLVHVMRILVECQPELEPRAEEFELDLNRLSEKTLFELYRLAMNWQKSKKKVLLSRRTSEGGLDAIVALDGGPRVEVVAEAPKQTSGVAAAVTATPTTAAAWLAQPSTPPAAAVTSGPKQRDIAPASSAADRGGAAAVANGAMVTAVEALDAGPGGGRPGDRGSDQPLAQPSASEDGSRRSGATSSGSGSSSGSDSDSSTDSDADIM
eukprot:SM000043S15834  [mRNA]  locus=s43:402591:404843:- [translate_table: standard]